MAYECRMGDPLSRVQPQALRLATGDFQHREGGFVAADDRERMRGRLLDDLLDPASSGWEASIVASWKNLSSAAASDSIPV